MSYPLAHYRETWEEGLAGWGSHDTWLHQVPHGEEPGPFIRYRIADHDDCNHLNGVGVVNVGPYLLTGSYSFEPSAYLGAGEVDLRDARVSVWVKGRRWDPRGTQLVWWVQTQPNPDVNTPDGRLGEGWWATNWAFTSQDITPWLLTGKWEKVEFSMSTDEGDWTYAGDRGRPRPYAYWPIGKALRFFNYDFMFNVIGVDPFDKPTGMIDFADFNLTYRNTSLLHPSNGGHLISSPSSGCCEPAMLTDGWRHGSGKMWGSNSRPSGSQELIWELEGCPTLRAVQIHQNPDFRSRRVEVAVSTGSNDWEIIMDKEFGPAVPPQGKNFDFLTEPRLSARACFLRVRILSGYHEERWGLGEVKAFSAREAERESH